jgi:hypothetical protein
MASSDNIVGTKSVSKRERVSAMARRLFWIVLSVALAALAAPAYAEDDSSMRLVRLSYLEGHVSYQRSSEADWSAPSINFPLEPGDRIYTGQDGRAEIQFDDGSVIRLAENTDFEILALNDDLIQVRILLGLATLTAAGSVDFEIDTPSAAFSTLLKGVYRFDVIENGDTDAIVRKGELEAANNLFSERIITGELLHVRGDDDANPALSQYNRRDLWDEWNDRRNADLRADSNRSYLPNNVYIGASDMDRYGRWVDVDTYGTAWVPISVDADWSPYSVGRWCYRPIYGWTWVSYETWGWLPYHYGRWYHSAGFGWCWIPGPAFSFNFWSPGLVVFYNGPGWVSWCPLGPGDYYDISNYHFNHKVYSYQLTQLSALHVRLPEDPFNRHIDGAFRTVDLEHFKNGSFNDKNAGTNWKKIDQPWKDGALVKDHLSVPPSSVSFRPAPGRQMVQPKVNNSMPVVVRSNPNANAGARERFIPITNPGIPKTPSRELHSYSRPGANDIRNSGVGTYRRAIPNQPRERTDPGVQVSPGSTIYQQDGRGVNAPRGSDARENSGTNAGSAPAARFDNPPATRQIAPRSNNERPTATEPRTSPLSDRQTAPRINNERPAVSQPQAPQPSVRQEAPQSNNEHAAEKEPQKTSPSDRPRK